MKKKEQLSAVSEFCKGRKQIRGRNLSIVGKIVGVLIETNLDSRKSKKQAALKPTTLRKASKALLFSGDHIDAKFFQKSCCGNP